MGSLTIGSGSSAPPVDTRRREGKLPASVVSTPIAARFCTIGPPISASLLPPGERPPFAKTVSFFPTTLPISAANSPTLGLPTETPS
jgi:hypothetical protein